MPRDASQPEEEDTTTGRPVPIVCLGASAGGVETLSEVLRLLPGDLPAAVLVVMHLAAGNPSVLAKILDKAGPLRVTFAVDGEPLRPAHVYVAPPDRHLVVESDRLRLGRGPRENGSRPSIDVAFRSLAPLGGGAMAVVLSGMLDDGTVGLLAVKDAGGFTVVQDPDSALFPSMPRSAVEAVHPDAVVPIDQAAQLVVRWARERAGAAARAVPSGDDTAQGDPPPPSGRPSEFTCPDCGGVLFEQPGSPVLHFRCRVGHAFSPDSLAAAQSERLEDALWSAHVALQERRDLLRRLCDRMEARGMSAAALRYGARLEALAEQAELVRRAAVELGEQHGPDVGGAAEGARRPPGGGE